MQIEMHDVPAQRPQPTDDPLAHCRTRVVRNDEFGRHPQQAIRARPGLTHENVALFGLEPRAAGRVLPTHIDIARRNPRAARSAGAGRAFERQIDALPQAGIKNGFALAAVEGEFAILVLDGNFHVAFKSPSCVLIGVRAKHRPPRFDGY